MSRRRAGAALLSVLAILALSGCSDDPKHARPKPGSAHRQPVGAVADLSEVSCKPGAGGEWEGTGTLTNATRQARTYDVTFAVIRPKTSEVEGKVEKTVTVKSHAARRITLPSIYRGAVKSGRCVFTVTLE